jgi:putative ABC transport system substrate-binding protein
VARRAELICLVLRALVPSATRVGVLVNPLNISTTVSISRDVELAAHAMGLQFQVHKASTSREIDAAIAAMTNARVDMLFVGNDPFLDSRRVQLVQLANQHRVPATYSGREHAEVGGLMSYGAKLSDAFYQVGAYAGRILKGAKPADLPVQQSTKVELVINLKTAKALGLTIPINLLGRADEVIE